MGNRNDHPQGGLQLGYARVSTTKQSLERQLDALDAAGIPQTRIYSLARHRFPPHDQERPDARAVWPRARGPSPDRTNPRSQV